MSGFIAFATGRRTDTAGLIDGRQNTVSKAILIAGERNRSRLLPINKRRCSMPVTHDLYQDLKLSKEEIQQKRTKDPLLDSLINKYSQADAEVLKAESAQSDAPSDDALKKLKEKRVQVKNKIVERLQTPS
jgi:uncharacterized protein YdcH (DUF465 family)